MRSIEIDHWLMDHTEIDRQRRSPLSVYSQAYFVTEIIINNIIQMNKIRV